MNKKIPFDVLKQVEHFRKAPTAKLQVGMGTFIPQIQMIEIRYCEHGGSSTSLIQFLKSKLHSYALEYPYVHFKIHPRPRKHPVLIGRYANGDCKQICVKNEKQSDINKQLFNLLNSQNGQTFKIMKTKLPVLQMSKRVN